ncbi:hypothetical protein SAT01_12190 [Sinomonas atrocyanea]|nr:hypothetical protein SAT01_12190 [Sinomonas atrocyanea]GGG74452.1 hypothetical protein GCM10007172_28980 [Sinomonas atrocyanea]
MGVHDDGDTQRYRELQCVVHEKDLLGHGSSGRMPNACRLVSARARCGRQHENDRSAPGTGLLA